MGASRARFRVGVVGAAVLAAITASVAPTGATAAPARVGARYAVAVPVCSGVTVGYAHCDAMRLVPASKSTPGALPMAAPGTFKGETGNGYSPAQLATAYDVDADSATGSTQTVAVVDADDDPNALADLNTFDAYYGLPAETTRSFAKVDQTGGTQYPTADASWAAEMSLDIEAIRGICHQCRILLVEANTAANANMHASMAEAVALGANEISASFGSPEPPGGLSAATAKALITAFNFPHVAVVAATGDHGWRAWDLVNEFHDPQYGPDYPSSLPNVVAVGGTTLTLTAADKRASETVWNRNGDSDSIGWPDFKGEGATGGGCSISFKASSWQLAVPGFSDTGCGKFRMAGDIAADGDPHTGFDIYDSYLSGGWQTLGGTSLSTPLIAAMWALAGGPAGVKSPGRTLYRHAGEPGFYDVKSGGNAYCGFADPDTCAVAGPFAGGGPAANPNDTDSGTVDCAFAPFPSTDTTPVENNKECRAAVGYDGPSGLGTPIGLSVFQPAGPTGRITTPKPVKVKKSGKYSVDTADATPGAKITYYKWTWGDGSPSSHGKSPTHAFKEKGTYLVKVYLEDSDGLTGDASLEVTVGKKPKVDIGGPASLKIKKNGEFQAEASDPNTGGKITSYKWTFGDGSTDHGSKVKHAFKKPGKYRVTVTVTDDSGLSEKAVLTVDVTK